MMISGITQSLNSGFSQNISTSLTPDLTPTLTPGALSTPGSTFTSSLTPCLTPSLNPALNPGLQPASVQSYMGSGGMDPSSLRHLKHSQLRKPPTKSSVAEPNMTEEEVNMRFIQELLSWVEEMQVRPRHGLFVCKSKELFEDCAVRSVVIVFDRSCSWIAQSGALICQAWRCI